MRQRDHSCGPRGRIHFSFPEGLMAMRGGRGWQGNWGPFHFDIGDGPGGGGRGRRGRRRMFESGELRLVLLKLIADQPRHGYDLIRAVEELTGGEYGPSPGVVYPTLTLLQDMGLIEEAEGEGARRPFQVTDAGRAHLEENQADVEELIGRLEELDPGERPTAGPAIGRAVKNLMTALSHRVGRDGLDDDLLHEIAAILDEAAQRIERVK
ncbi:MAG TPA: PadR family transcriptional regulator [Sphingomicrobium sp.]|jgi:DNA-binding PadR family transcriptional regulator